MADTDPQVPETVSVEAHTRVQHENEQLQTKVGNLETALVDQGKLRRTESYLRDKGIPKEEVAGRVDLLAPHLSDVSLDNLEEALGSEKFAPLVQVPAPTLPPLEPDADGQPPAPLVADGGFGNQPNPGGTDPVVTQGLVGPGDTEYDQAFDAARKGDHAKMEALFKADRVKEPVKPW